MAARAGVTLEDDVATLVDGEAIILVHNGAEKMSSAFLHDKSRRIVATDLSSMTRLVVLQSNPSVL